MENFTPISAIIGGLIIGTAAASLLWLNGRIAGISGIVGGLVSPTRTDFAWRLLFAIGLVIGVGLYLLAGGPLREIEITAPLPVLIIAGLLVGFGTQMGGGCTSGHGVCGIARFSVRSIAATITFIVTAGITLTIARHVLGIV
jgi:uncharacterized membrane protein YedE/YeeE